jgi:hypothetical protein
LSNEIRRIVDDVVDSGGGYDEFCRRLVLWADGRLPGDWNYRLPNGQLDLPPGIRARCS